jgi:hypothetical protein
MGQLRPEKLHVNYLSDVPPEAPIMPRRYTLTHSDSTGDLFLSIGSDYNHKQISGWYTRFMRDEVLAEWKEDENGVSLHLYCHISGGMILGRVGWRESIFRSELPLVLKAIRHGDRRFFDANPELDNSLIIVHFQSSRRNNTKIEAWGTPASYIEKR